MLNVCSYRSGTVNSKSFVGKILLELSGNSNYNIKQTIQTIKINNKCK